MKRLLFAIIASLCGFAAKAVECIPSGVTDQFTYFVAVDATDFTTRETGLTTFTVYRSRNGGAATAYTTPTINETSAANMPGVYELLLDEDMTIDSGDDVQHVTLHITHAGMAPVTKEVCIGRPKITAGETLTVSAGNGAANVTQYNGTNGTATAGIPAVNTTQLNGTSQTARDIGASVLISSGTGTGQLSVTSGVIASNVQQFGGSAGTFAGGRPEVNASHWGGTAVASAVVNANVVQQSGDSAVADRIEAFFDGTCGSYPEFGITRGVGCTAQAYTAATPSITLDASAPFGDNTLAGATVLICGSTQGYCQPAIIASNVSTGDIATLTQALPVEPTGTITFTIIGTTIAELDPADIRAAVGLASPNMDTQFSGIQSDTNDVQTRLPAALVSGRMDSSTGAMAANVITSTAINNDAFTAAKFASDVGTEFGTATWATTTRLLTAGTNIVLAKGTGITGFNDLDAAGIRGAVGLATNNLDTQLSGLDGKIDTIDTVADAIKVKTDQLTFGVTNELNVNVESMNANSVCGTGDPGTPWTGCP